MKSRAVGQRNTEAPEAAAKPHVIRGISLPARAATLQQGLDPSLAQDHPEEQPIRDSRQIEVGKARGIPGSIVANQNRTPIGFTLLFTLLTLFYNKGDLSSILIGSQPL